ncbi:MAG TPA: Fe2+-dependent dioxygenase [Polyangia bacterium]|nr:Fe2+-dependent dioxygenase [Polyangia bacterium]
MSAIVIASAVPPDVVAQIRARMERGPLVSGKITAVGRAQTIKDNLILGPDSPGATEAVELLVGALKSSQLFQAAAWPEAMLRPLFCRYGVGMKYGDHVDAAMMGDPTSQVRCDVAMTVCLSDAAEYEGGALIIDAAGVPTSWRGKAGDVIVYPAGTLHRVTEVTAGNRDVAISWIQSMVRDADCRRILYDLKSTLDAFDALPTPPAEAEAIRRSYFNLIRMWA